MFYKSLVSIPSFGISYFFHLLPKFALAYIDIRTIKSKRYAKLFLFFLFFSSVTKNFNLTVFSPLQKQWKLIFIFLVYLFICLFRFCFLRFRGLHTISMDVGFDDASVKVGFDFILSFFSVCTDRWDVVKCSHLNF